MYPHEMMEFLQSRGYSLNREELLQVINVHVNTHLTYVKYNPYSNSYDMWDRYGNHYYFNVKGE